MLNQTPGVDQPSAKGECELTLRSLFAAEESSLLRYAFSLIGRRAVAEEIVQEVFLQLHASWDAVESPRAWLYRSVRNRAYNHVRDNQRETVDGDAVKAQGLESAGRSPEATVLQMEATQALRQMIEELEASDRQLVILKYFQGLKYRDISQKTGLSVSNVGYRLHHILKELANKLRMRGIDGMS